ncbi:MAG: amidohydrolase, partial [Maribacter sp.]
MRVILIFFLVSLCISCNPKPIASYDLVVQNGTLIHLETGKLSKESIFISDGRIKEIVPSDSVFTFEAKEEIDATGKFILPGFWDNHVHFRGGDSLISANKDFLKLFMANGITTVRDAGGDLTSSVLGWRKDILEGKLTGPTIFTSGPKIDGKS